MRDWAKGKKYDSMGERAGKIANTFIVSAILTLVCSFAIQCAGSSEAHAASSTLTLSITDNVVVNLLPSTNGTFATSDTSTPNISVTTNHATGYTLGIKASTEGANSLVNTTDSNKTIPSIVSSSFPSGVSESDYADDTYASTNNLNNTWGYRPSKLNSVANSNYLSAPTSATNTVILDQTNAANSTANTYNVAIGARVDNTAKVGSYAATFIITAVVNPITYNITYNDNSSSAGSGFPSNVVNQQTMDTTVQLSSTTPTRTTYDFAGWCTVNTADNGTCTGTQYQAGDNWILDQTTNPNNLTLYAMWNIKTHNIAITFAGTGVSSVKVCTVSGDCTGSDFKGTVSTSGGSVSGLVEGNTYYLYPAFSSGYELDNWANTGSYGTLSSTSATNPTFTIGAGDGAVRITGKSSKIYMQSMTSSQCTTTPQTVYDSRDEQAYKVAKLADGKCWMVENLNLAGGTAIEATKTDVDANYISSFTTSNNLTKSGSTIVLPASSTSGFDTDNYSYVYNSGNKTNCGASGQNTPCYSYYSWDAATLGSGRSISTDNQNAPYSICPKGWKLPSTYNGTNSSTDFRALMIAYGGSNSIQSYSSSTSPTGATMYNSIGPGTTPNFLLAGLYGYGSFFDGGSGGYYWSSTSYGNTDIARYLVFSSSSVDSASSSIRSGGFSVRCLRSS